MRSIFVVLVLLADYAVSTPAGLHLLSNPHEKRHESSSLHRGQRVDSDSITNFRIAVKQSNLEHGYTYLTDVSDPQSPQFGHHWTPEQVHNTFAPTTESMETVKKWLETSGVQNIQESKGWLTFETTIDHAETLLHADYYEHESADGSVRIGCDQYYLPQHISPYVDFITPGVALSPPVKKKTFRRHSPQPYSQWRHHAPSFPWWHHGPYHLPPNTAKLPPDLHTCGRNITPACIRALYAIPVQFNNALTSNTTNTVGVLEVADYDQSDLDAFFTHYAANVPNGTHPTTHSIEPPGSDVEAIKEATVDIDILYSLVYPQTVTVYKPSAAYGKTNKSASSTLELSVAMENFLDALDRSYCSPGETADGTDCGVLQPARVTSISFATSELLFPPALLERQCNEFMKLGLQGHTFVASSGDYGVAQQPQLPPYFTNGCIDPSNITASLLQVVNGTVFNPSYPANCPYILVVGGTQLNDNDTVLDSESAMNTPAIVAANGIVVPPGTIPPVSSSSSGGFSNYFSRPAYQNDAVDAYFAHHDPGYPYYAFNGVGALQSGRNIGANGGLYNRIGRAMPDVSANGASFMNYAGGSLQPEYGTSLATPIWASILTIINEKRTAAGKGPVGFVNPTLYKSKFTNDQ